MRGCEGITTSYSLSLFTPFALVPPPEEFQGILIGEDVYRRPVYLNYNRLPNFHGIIVGQTGSGKSTTVESLLYDLVQHGINFMCIDPGLDYVYATKDLGGLVIDIAENIVDIFDAPVDRAYWYSMIADAFADALGLDAYHAGMIRNALQNSSSPDEILDELTGYPDIVGRMNSIIPYILEPNLDMKEILESNTPICIVYRGRKRVTPEAERFITMYFIIYTREYFMSKAPTHRPQLIVVIDEAWRLLKGVQRLNLVDYIREMRKFGVGYWIITQSVTDMPLEAYEQFGFTLALSGPRVHAMKLDALAKLSKQDIDWLLYHKQPGYGILIRSGFAKPTQLRVIVREEVLRRRRK